MESTITPQLATNSAEDIAGDQILGFSYWFATPEVASLNHWTLAVLAVLSTLILIASLGLVALKLLNKKLNPPQQKYLTKVAWSLVPFGLIGWLLVLARLLGVVFFSARFWWPVWLAGLVAVGFWLYLEYKKLPLKQVQYQTYQLKRRYFPKKKKR